MATFKVVVQHQRSDGLYVVYIRLTHNRKVINIKTDKMVNSKGVVAGKHDVKDPFVLNSCMLTITKWVDMLNRYDISNLTVEQVRDILLTPSNDLCFSDFAREYIEKISNTHQPRTIELNKASLIALEKFAGSNKIMFSQMTTTFVQSWIDSLSHFKRVKETYPVTIKTIFKAGLLKYNDYDNDIIRIKVNPWLKVIIPKHDAPEKKAITMEECRKFFALNVTQKSRKMAQDIGKMILCLAGINGVDLYRMKKSAYYDGILHYERAKTRTRREDKAYIEIRVPDMLIPTLEKYLSDEDDEYLFKFHKMFYDDRSFVASQSHEIRLICLDYLGMKKEDKTYSTYTFRHTWATIAQNDLGASFDDVAFGLNHVNRHRVTMGYVKPDFSRIWEINEKIVEKVFFTNDKSKRLIEHHAPVFEKVVETFELSADAYFMGEVVGHVEGKGYRNTDDIIQQLMDNINDTVPKNCTIQIKVNNITKDQTKYFERMRDKK